LQPLGGTDGLLLRTIAQGDFLVQGFRNRDVRHALHGRCADPRQRRRDMARVSRQLALLRAHGLIRKVSRTHRYMVTASGRRVITALLAALHANTEQLVSFAT